MLNQWTATYTPTSANSGRLKVSGECLSVGGETFALRKHHPQQRISGTLILDKVESTPGGKLHNDLAKTVVVTYEEDLTHQTYSQVEILPDQINVAVVAAQVSGN